MEHGEKIKLLREFGADLSESGLEDAPELEEFNHEYWFAFWELDSTRRSGFSKYESITFSEMLSYCVLNEVQEKKTFQTMILAMDAAYLEVINKPAPGEQS